MANLTRAYKQLFSRSEDERFGSIEELLDNCRQRRDSAEVKWVSPHNALVAEHNGELKLKLYGDTAYSFKPLPPLMPGGGGANPVASFSTASKTSASCNRV